MINEWDFNNIRFSLENGKQISIAQHGQDKKSEWDVSEVALIHGDGDMDIHPFSDLDSLIEALTKVKSELK
tara:strand:- start:1004 stop:1216 length:213 start_codon:yes stop_codon:yes gene_type:complete